MSGAAAQRAGDGFRRAGEVAGLMEVVVLAHGSGTWLRAESDCAEEVATVTLSGELDLCTAPTAEAELRSACRPGALVVLDLGQLTFMDCAGLRVVLDADARLRLAGGRMVIVHLCAQVSRLLDLTGAGGWLELAREPPATAQVSVA